MKVNDAAYYTGAKAKVLHEEECRQCTSKAVEEERERIRAYLLKKHEEAHGIHNYYLCLAVELFGDKPA